MTGRKVAAPMAKPTTISRYPEKLARYGLRKSGAADAAEELRPDPLG